MFETWKSGGSWYEILNWISDSNCEAKKINGGENL